MITDLFLEISYSLFQWFLMLFPAVPQLDQTIMVGVNHFFEQVNAVNGVVIYLVGSPLYLAAIGIILFVLLYDLALKVMMMLIFKLLLKKVVG